MEDTADSGAKDEGEGNSLWWGEVE